MQDLNLILQYTKELNVLYVEDDLELLESTAALFQEYFQHIEVASDGESGLEQYQRYSKDNSSFYDLVITDINMPVLNGLEMSEAILNENPMQSIIIISAHDEINYLLKSIELGINAFLTKPIDKDNLSKTLYRVSQAISDHKFVESHLDMVEELNMQLEIQNKELIAKNIELEKSFRMLDTVINKEKLITPHKEVNLTTQVPSEQDERKYEQIKELINTDLFELKEILVEIDISVIEIIHNVEHISSENLDTLIELFAKYASILRFYSFFDELSFSISSFSTTMRENPLPENIETTRNIFMLVESFVYVLGSWHDDISSGDETKINQFDASIISDMHTIINMWTQVEQEYNEDDLDDIFDF